MSRIMENLQLPPVHSSSSGILLVGFALGAICISVGILLLYKAIKCRTFGIPESRHQGLKSYPLWVGRTIAVFIGVIGVAIGIVLILRSLNAISFPFHH